LKIISKIKETLISNSEFRRNIGITTIGNSVAYLLGFLFTPFIARVYLPEAYGTFAIFNSITINLTLFSTLNYNNAIILPKLENDLIKLLQLIFILLVINFFINYGLIILGGKMFVEVLNLSDIGDWLFFIPVIVFFSGIFQTLISLANRLKEFKSFSKSKIISMGTSKSFTLGYGYIFSGNFEGLILGDFLLKILGILFIVTKKTKSYITRLFNINSRDIFEIARKYKNYPKYYLPATWILIIMNQIPLYFLTIYSGASSAGYFAFAISMLNIPVLFFSNSISAVYIQKASIYYPKKTNELKSLSLYMVKVLIIFSSLAFGLIFGFGDYIFRVVLGNNWINAGRFASILSLGYVIYFIALPFNTLYRIFNLEKQFLLYNAVFFLIILFTFLLLFNSSEEMLILIYSIEFGIYSLTVLGYIFIRLKLKNLIFNFFKLLTIIGVIFSLFYLIRRFIDPL
jgi:O-antigen/teichoic acid export membrane protein